MAEIKIKLANGEEAGKTFEAIQKNVRLAATELNKLEQGTKEWQAAARKLADAKKLQEEYTEELKQTTAASDTLNKAWNSLPGAQFFNQIGESLKMTSQGVGGLVSKMGLLKFAIASTGIGLLVVVLGSLYTWFQKVNTGADFLEDTFARIGATIDVVIDRLGRFGSGLVAFFNGDFEEGIELMSSAFKGMGEEMKREQKEAASLTARMRDLEDAERDYRIQAAETENQIKQLMLQARNRSLSEEQRIALLDRAMKLEKDLNALQLKNATEGLAIANQSAAQRLNINRQVGESEIAFGKRVLEEFKKDGQVQADDLRDKVEEMLLAISQAQGKSIELQEKIQNQRDDLAQKREAAIAKEIADDIKRAEEDIAREQQAQQAIIAELEKAFADSALLYEQNYNERNTAEYQQGEEELRLQREKNAKVRDEIAAHLAAVEAMEAQAKGQLLNETANFGMAIAQSQAQDSARRLSQLREQHGEESVIYQQAARQEGERIKRAERAQVAINLISELSTIWKKAAEFGPFQTIVAGLQTGAALIRARTAQKNIDSMQFYTGGYTGPGDKYAPRGIVHAGEVVWSQEDVARFGGVAAVEAIRPTAMRQLYTGGPVNPYEDRSRAPMVSAAASGTTNPIFDYDMLGSVIAREVDKAMSNKISTIRVEQNLTETRKGLTTLQKLENEVDV